MLSGKEYIVTLMAVFLSLGIGIMVGTSLTESIILEQQKSIIEQLERRYFDVVEENERLLLDNEKQYAVLDIWEKTVREIFPPPRHTFSGKEIGIFSFDQVRGEEVSAFLKKEGLKINPHIYVLPSEENKNLVNTEMVKEIFSLGKMLLNESWTAPFLDRPEKFFVQSKYCSPANPQIILLVGGQSSLNNTEADLIAKYLQEMVGVEIIVLEDFFRARAFLQESTDLEAARIDYIDTTPGKIALLALLGQGIGN